MCEKGFQSDEIKTYLSAHWLSNDWAAALFLGGIQCDPPLSPSFYGGSREHGLIILEDLGDGEAPTTHNALYGNDPVTDRKKNYEKRDLSIIMTCLVSDFGVNR